MKRTMSKSILLLPTCLLLLCILTMPAVGWPPACPSPCEYWNGYECYCHEACCYDSDCGTGIEECLSCNLDTCTCEDDQSKCSGCCKCDYGMCVNDQSKCSGCCKCSGCDCVDEESKCASYECCRDCDCVDPQCDGCGYVGENIWECFHPEGVPNGYPCSTTHCIYLTMLSATCTNKGSSWPCAKSRCNTTLFGFPPGQPEVVKQVHYSQCPGGYVYWVLWFQHWFGCSNCDSDGPYLKACQVGGCAWNPAAGWPLDPEGYRKKCGGCSY